MTAAANLVPPRLPRPFEPRTVALQVRGTRWRIRVARYWMVAVSEDWEPDALVWSAEREHRQYRGVFERVAGDDVPVGVAKQAAAFHRQCASDDIPDGARVQLGLF